MKQEPYPIEATGVKLALNHTKTPQSDAQWLVWKARQTVGDFVEIGTNRGEMALELSLLSEDRHVWTCDYPGNTTIQDWQKSEVLPAVEIGVASRYRRNVHLIIEDSKKLDYDRVGPVGFVFIDGDHSAEGVTADGEKALKYFAEHKLPRPACIVWHDYGTGCMQGIKDYLDAKTNLDLRWVEGTTGIVYLDL